MIKYLTINTVVEGACFICSFLWLSREKSRIWKYFSFYLLINCVTELLGIYLKSNHENNQWPYNIAMIFEAGFVTLMLGEIMNKFKKGKPIVISGLAIIFVAYCYDSMAHSFTEFHDVTYNILSVIFVVISLYFFYLMIKDEGYIDLKYSSSFWWATGTLFFYFGSTAVNLFRGKLHILITPKHFLTYYIYIVLNILLYTCWSYSFICRRWLTPTSKSLS